MKINKFLAFLICMLISTQSIVSMEHPHIDRMPQQLFVNFLPNISDILKDSLANTGEKLKSSFLSNYQLPLYSTSLGFALGIGSVFAHQFSHAHNLLPSCNNLLIKRLAAITPWLSLIFGIGTNEIAIEKQEHSRIKCDKEIIGLKLLSTAFLVAGSYVLGRKLMLADLDKINLSPIINIMSIYNT